MKRENLIVTLGGVIFLAIGLVITFNIIENKEYNISEIAYMVGFNDAHYFSKCFKQTYGISPTEYKNNIDR